MTYKRQQNYLTLYMKKNCHRVEYFLSVCDAFLQYISNEDFAPIQFIAVFPCEQARPHRKYS